MTMKELQKVEITEEKIEKIFKKLEDLCNEIEKSTSFQNVREKMELWNLQRDHYLTLYWISYIGYLEDITDPKYIETEKIMGPTESKMDQLKRKYYHAILQSPFRIELEKYYGSRLFAIAENETQLKNADVSQEITKEKELYKEYLGYVLKTKFLFEGEEKKLSNLMTYFTSPDRSLRKKAYDKRFEILLSLEDKIDEIQDSLIQLRTKRAQKLGYRSYTDCALVELNRIGYGRKEIETFCEQVKTWIVPLLGELERNRENRLHLEDISYYDSALLFSDGNAKIHGTREDVLQVTSEILHEVCEESALLYDDLLRKGLIDTTDQENKSNSGITTYLPDYKTPLFLKKYRGLETDITTIHHEFGHTQQLYYSQNLPFHENRWPTFDICEIHSSSMEFLMYPFIERYFKEDASKYKIRHLTAALSQIVRSSMMNEFQTFLYDEPNRTKEERKQKWRQLEEAYFPFEKRNHPYFDRGSSWQSDTNRFDNPFYGIDYALAYVCALSFYRKQKENVKKSWEDFIALCKLGGSKSLLELIEFAQLDSPFEEGTLKSVASSIAEEIEEQVKATGN